MYSYLPRKLYYLIPIVLFSLLASSMTAIEKSSVVRIDSIEELPLDHPSDTLIFFDLDDTLFDFPYMVGSKAWRRYIAQATRHLEQNWHDIFSLLLAQRVPVVAVEPKTVDVLKKLQSKGYILSGLTARDRQLWYDTPAPNIDILTISQLRSVAIDFDTKAIERRYPTWGEESEYYEGVFFANSDSKGDMINKVIKDLLQKPEKILFIDDKLSQVDSVSKALQELGIPHECYWYCATEEKAALFNPLIANIQLYYLWMSNGQERLSDEEAEAIARREPPGSVDGYLEAITLSCEGGCYDSS